MGQWEFLLQKEGDRSWLPLDSTDVEILEGRYRVVARSNLVKTAVEVCISHLLVDEIPPKRRVQKRSSQTSEQGLMVVIPFTWLQPGMWELRCSSTDVMSDLLGSGWQHSVRLQVMAHQPEEDWEPDWSSPTEPITSSLEEMKQMHGMSAVPQENCPTNGDHPMSGVLPEELSVAAGSSSPGNPLQPKSEPSVSEPNTVADSTQLNPEIAEILGASMERLLQMTEQLSEKLIDEALGGNGLPTRLESDPLQHRTMQNGTSFAIELEHPALVASRGEDVAVLGRVVAIAVSEVTNESTGNPGTSPIHSKAEIQNLWEPDVVLSDLSKAFPQELQLCLRDPQTLQMLVRDRQPVPNQEAKGSFDFRFTLPRDIHTRLVLGEVLLCGSLPSSSDESVVIATQAFTITVDPRELVGEMNRLTTILAEELEDQAVDLPSALSMRLAQQPTLSLDLSFLDMVATEPPQSESPPRFPSLVGQPLPPQIYQPDSSQPRQHSLKLPNFVVVNPSADDGVNPSPEDVAELFGETPIARPSELSPSQPLDEAIAPLPDLESRPKPLEDKSIASPSPEFASSEDVENPVSGSSDTGLSETSSNGIAALDAPVTVVPAEMTEIDQTAEPMEAVAIATSDAAVSSESSDSESFPSQASSLEPSDSESSVVESPPLPEPCPIQTAFQALRLEERFLSRLASLATDSQRLAEPQLDESAVVITSAPAVRTVLAPDTDYLAHEIVVDDEPLPSRTAPTTSQAMASSGKAIADRTESSNPLVLSDDEPVPKPCLEITDGELVSGQLLQIRVKLPDLLPRIYVKLWVIDCQTRALLEPPHWLVDFTPNGFGALEAHLQLIVPFGSIEVQFEAIAVEVQTQRESHKVKTSRKVIPPDLPVMALDAFEL